MGGYHDMGNWFYGFHNHINQTEEFSQLATAFPFPPENFLDPAKANKIHRTGWEYIFRSLDKRFDDLIAAGVASYQEKELGLTKPAVPREADQWARKLRQQGFAHLPTIDAQRLAAIRESLAACSLTRDKYSCPEQRMPITEIRKNSNVGQIHSRDVILARHAIALANDPAILAAITQYFGALPTIVDYGAWWSFADAEHARDAQLFHFDMDNYRFCKLFIYLNDVDMNTGPHVYVPGSHRFDAIAKARSELEQVGIPADVFNEWFYTKLRKEDDETRLYLGIDPVELTGPAGSAFIVDTRGIHKGMLPVIRDRFVFQIEYALTPIPTEAFEPVALTAKAASREITPDNCKSPLFRYVNQLYLDLPVN